MRGCQICGQVPRQMWLFGGTPYWRNVFRDDRVCPTCFVWAIRVLQQLGWRGAVLWR